MGPRLTSLHVNLVVVMLFWRQLEVAHACHSQAIHGGTEREVRSTLGRHDPAFYSSSSTVAVNDACLHRATSLICSSHFKRFSWQMEDMSACCLSSSGVLHARMERLEKPPLHLRPTDPPPST
jgi:hypothetical protein